MEINKIHVGDYITFKYGEMPYFNYITGKVISLSMPDILKIKSIKDLSWKEKIKLEGHVALLASDGTETSLCLAQAINGCEFASIDDIKEWHSSFRSHVQDLKNEVGRLQKLYAKAIHTSN